MIGIDWDDGFIYNVEKVPSQLSAESLHLLRQHLVAMGIDQNSVENAVSDIDACLKKEFLRTAADSALPNPALVKENIAAIKKAATQLLQAFESSHDYSFHMIGQQVERTGQSGDLHTPMSQVRHIEEACATLLSNWPKGGRRQKSGTLFVTNRERGTAYPLQAAPRDDSSTRQLTSNGKVVCTGGNSKAEIRQADPHDFTPVMRELDSIWHSITGTNLRRSSNTVKMAKSNSSKTSPFDPIGFVSFILSRVHDGITRTQADRKIRDYEKAVSKPVKEYVRRN